MQDIKAINRVIEQLQVRDRSGIFEKRPEDLAAAMRDRSEREFLILLGSTLEERLKYRIDTHFSKMSPRLGIMTEGNGAARTFSQRINLASKFELIGEETKRLSELLGEMRNYAAHHLGPVDFETPAIRHAAEVYVAPHSWPDTSYLRRLRLIGRTFFIGVFENEEGRYESLNWES